MRFLKQLEFPFPSQTVVAPYAVVGQPLRLSSSKLASDALALQFQARELLRSLGADELARKIRVEWNPRMRTAAGRADYREKLISLNPLLRDLSDGFPQREASSGKLDRPHRSSPTSDSRYKLDCLKQSSF